MGLADQRVISYIQATSQVALNLASVQNPDEFIKKQILRYLTITFSVICEYLTCETSRIKSAAFAAIRLIISYGLKPSLLVEEAKDPNDITSILNFDALTISEEVANIRSDRRSKK
jgi:hypothetical protein